MTKVVTRFPPSPTGYFHIGSARTALFNYLFTAHAGGTMFLRFEDTDKARSKKEFEEDILAGLSWLGISCTEAKPLRQSERTAVYSAAIQTLLDKDAAYISKEPAKDDPSREVAVVRLRNPGQTIPFTDIIRGDVTFDTAELKDFVIARGIEDPLYNFTVVVDDADMKVTHVIRGEDHISNTARQILILETLGYERPQYAHIPLILAPDKSKLSKRHGAVSINEYRAQGYLPEALVNYLALLGWNPGGEQELFSLKELAEKFDFAQVHKAGAVFDIEKLRWFNREHMNKMSLDAFAAEALSRLKNALGESVPWSEEKGRALMPLLRERISTWIDIDALVQEGEVQYFFSEPKLDPKKLPGKGSDAATTKRHLTEVRKLLSLLPSSQEMDPERVKKAVWAYAEAEGRGAVLWPFRYALTGRERSPDPFTVASLIGKESMEKRLDTAITALDNT